MSQDSKAPISKPFRPGDKVTAREPDRFPRRKYANQIFTVLRCNPSNICRSGWTVAVTCLNGKVLQGYDSNWFVLVEDRGEDHE